MQKLRFALGALVLLALVAGCGGAKYAEEKTVLTAVTKAMETFTSAIGTVDTPDGLASILGTFSSQLEKFVPQMKSMTEAHPEWANEPPKELAETLDKFKQASTGFQGAMPKVMEFAAQHADNPTLKSALDKFQSVVSQL